MSESKEVPYQALGKRLKALRQKMQESLPDVSGAVEIDIDLLLRIESGAERPSEDILQLLINHFEVNDEAEGLWQLAGYDAPQPDHSHDAEDLAKHLRTGAVMIMAMDPRVIYSDQVHATANRSGVVMHFAQKTNVPQPLIAARVGMSREQAHEVVRVLQEVLSRSEPRQLPDTFQQTDASTDTKND